MLSKALFSFSLLGLIASFSAVGEEVATPSPSPSEPQISVEISADQVKEVKIISDDKKSVTVYAVEKVDERLVDGSLLKDPTSEATQKIREEIKAKIIADGQPIETYKLKKGEYEKLQSESQGYWCRQARRAARRAYWGGGYGNNYCYSNRVYYTQPICYSEPVYYQPLYYQQPVYCPQPVYYSQPICYNPCDYNYGFYGVNYGFGVYIN